VSARAGCTSRSSTGVYCDRPRHPGDNWHRNELAGVEWFERRRRDGRPRRSSPSDELVHLDELVGWRGQRELALGDVDDVESHAVPTRARR
jgi:hypothetical protein